MNIIKGKIEKAQRCVIYGPEGIGKSTMGSKFPKPLFIDTEGSTSQLDVDRIERPSSWQILTKTVKSLTKNNMGYKTLVIDTADWADMLCSSHLCVMHDKTSIEDFGYGAGYVKLAEEFGRFLDLLTSLNDTGVHVVLLAHAIMRKFEQPDEDGSYDRWELKLSKKVTPLVREWADMVLFANYKVYIEESEATKKNKAKGGKRVMHTSHHPCWDAKNRHDLKPELPFDYSEISHCFKEDLLEFPKETKSEEVKPEAAQTGDTQGGIPDDLWDLMQHDGITIKEIQDAVEAQGHMSAGTSLEDYDKVRPGIVKGLLVAHWGIVVTKIKENRNTGEIK